MSAASTFLLHPARVWMRLFGFIVARNDKAVAAWGSSLQYKSRQTNPEEAMRRRVML